ncbi:MAG: ABC transporter permease [Desulfobacterales bacterium]|jgi:peptide/nickel transport system permease protein|nr:MAG: ABC transporter permease [Desulfobacterales bacterium]
MVGFLIRRILSVIPTMFIVVTVVFLLLHLIPGDPAAAMLGIQASAEQIAELRAQLGLDEPIYVQYVKYIIRVLHGDLGDSIFLKRSVVLAFMERVEPTILLITLGLVLAVLIGIPSGILSAVRPDSILDKSSMLFALLGVSIPTFWLGLNLIQAFSIQLDWLPASGYAPLSEGVLKSLRSLTLPAISLAFNQAALFARICRSSMLEVMQQDYIRTARSKGVSEKWVILKHALRNALLPTVTAVGTAFAALIGGTAIIEMVFNIPGAERLIISSILRRDYAVIQGSVLIIAMAYVFINLIIDIIYGIIDPRVTYE